MTSKNKIAEAEETLRESILPNFGIPIISSHSPSVEGFIPLLSSPKMTAVSRLNLASRRLIDFFHLHHKCKNHKTLADKSRL